MPNCEPWDIDLDCCELPDGDHDDLIAAKQVVASQMLHDGSGRHIGTCEVTVRPCLRRCGGGSGLPVPYKGSDGQWRNLGACGCTDDCSCVELSEVVLDGPVAEVTQVTIDGTVIDAEDYRLDKAGSGWRLLRIDGTPWPSCQDMTADCGEAGSFCVTYLQGIAPDVLATEAVSELTCELVKACIPGCKTCRLPKNIQSLTRRGVTITFDDAVSWLKQLPMVNAFLSSVNPAGLTSASGVWSPDVARPRITQVSGS